MFQRRTRRVAMVTAAIAGLLTAGITSCSTSDSGSSEAPDATGALDDPATTNQLQAVVDEVVAELAVPGVVVLVTRGDERWEIAVGTPELGSDDALQTGLAWPLRSITKSFTVTLMMGLVDDGLISLDDTIDQWVDGVPNGDEITLAQLAEMTSGLGDYTSEAFIEDFLEDPSRWFTLDELIGYGVAEPARAEPGTDRVYTNLNTLLLGRVVEEITGQLFDAALSERITEPLGLGETTYPLSADDGAYQVTGYSPSADGELSPDPANYSVFGPAGAMIATTDDLAVWGKALASGEPIGAASQETRLEAAPLAEGPEYDTYGLGIGELDGWWGHTGEGFGFTSLVMHDHTTDTTVVIVANASQLESHAPTTMFRRLAPLLQG